MKSFRFSVKDMDCASCVNVIMRKIKAFSGVRDVKIDPEKKEVLVQGDEPAMCENDIWCALEEMGYHVSLD